MMKYRWLVSAVCSALVIFTGVLGGGAAPRERSAQTKLKIRLVAYQQDKWPDPALNTDVLSVLQMVAIPQEIEGAARPLPRYIKIQYHYDASEDRKKIEDIKKRGGVFTLTATRDQVCDETIGKMSESPANLRILVRVPSWDMKELPQDIELPCYMALSPNMRRVQ